MTKKIGKKGKISEVQSADKATEVEGTSAIGGVQAVKPTSAIGSIAKSGAVGRRGPTRIMSAAEREQLLRMIDEEADKIFGANLPAERKKAVVDAVKMAVDSGINTEEQEE